MVPVTVPLPGPTIEIVRLSVLLNVNVACKFVDDESVKGPQADVPVHDALPLVLHPVNVDPALGVALHAPTDVPDA